MRQRIKGVSEVQLAKLNFTPARNLGHLANANDFLFRAWPSKMACGSRLTGSTEE